MFKTCSLCRVLKSTEDFYKCRQSTDGLRSSCKICTTSEVQKKTERLHDFQESIGCYFCQERSHFALEFHHINPASKSFAIGTGTHKANKMVEEMKKCLLVCSNCHKKIHGLILSVPDGVSLTTQMEDKGLTFEHFFDLVGQRRTVTKMPSDNRAHLLYQKLWRDQNKDHRLQYQRDYRKRTKEINNV